MCFWYFDNSSKYGLIMFDLSSCFCITVEGTEHSEIFWTFLRCMAFRVQHEPCVERSQGWAQGSHSSEITQTATFNLLVITGA